MTAPETPVVESVAISSEDAPAVPRRRTAPARSAAAGAGPGKKKKVNKKTAGRSQAARRKKRRAERRHNPVLAAVIILLAVVLLAGIGAVGYGMYRVSLVDTIYPGTVIEGVDLGGMTRREAAEALLALGAEKYDGLAVTAQLPLDNELTVTAYDAGLTYATNRAADAAWAYGRGGGALADTAAYMRAAYMGANSFAFEGDALEVSLDEEAVRSIVADAAVSIDEQLLVSGIEFAADEIHITKGAVGLTIDEEEVTSRFISALLAGDGSGFVYESVPEADETYDFQALYDEIHAEKVEAQLLYARDYGLFENISAAVTSDVEQPTDEHGNIVYPALPEGFDFNGQPYGVTRSVVGVSFDVPAAYAAWAAASYGDTVTIPLKLDYPDNSTEDIQSRLFADNLSKNWSMVRFYKADYCEEVRTPLAGSKPGRISNVKKACGLLNGIMLMPGDVFSYNMALGQRVPEAGWLLAPAYTNGEVRQEYGGGICQVSSTLYNAVLYSNLEVVERECHQFQVGYLPWGLDATVSWGWPDFKFRNNKDYPIEIVAWVDESTNQCCIQIKGTDTEHVYVVMHYSTDKLYDKDDGKTVIGTCAATYRWIYHDGDDYLTATPISRDWEAYSEYKFHDD